MFSSPTSCGLPLFTQDIDGVFNTKKDKKISTIKFNTVGKILKGDDSGSFVLILDDSINTGGYIILTSLDEFFNNSYDDWVEDIWTLEKYFEESKWEIWWNNTREKERFINYLKG